MLLTLLSRKSVVLAVAAVRITDVALPPTVVAQSVTLTVPAVVERMVAVPPTVSGSLFLPVSPARGTYAVAEVVINGHITVTVGVASLRLGGVAPSVSGQLYLAVPAARGTYAGVAPVVQYVKLVPVATLRYVVVSPTITGGGGVGIGVLPKRSGD
jgi:hypothetical protein